MSVTRPEPDARDADRLAEIEARLDELQHESQARRAELRALAVDLPAATSRRAMVRAMVGSIVHAPDKPMIAKRAVLKVLRTPADLFRRATGRR